jgi:hypothetical protein
VACRKSGWANLGNRRFHVGSDNRGHAGFLDHAVSRPCRPHDYPRQHQPAKHLIAAGSIEHAYAISGSHHRVSQKCPPAPPEGDRQGLGPQDS